MPSAKRLTFVVIGVYLNVVGAPVWADRPTDGEKIFAEHVYPTLREKCFACHSDEADELQGEFNAGSREYLLAGGSEYGDRLVVVGDAEASPLLAMLTRADDDFAMPPKQADRLSRQQVSAIRRWINAGALWPSERRREEIYAEYAAGVTVQTSAGLNDQWSQRKYEPENLWAFQPLRGQSAIDTSPSSGNPIDRFIDLQLKTENIQPAPQADRRTLIRRATFDLIGLPPTPEQVTDFVNDPGSHQEAFGDVIDRLLASPHYGEQAARHWLDVVRYADSSGFANDWERPNAWRYRDYVIRAFNDDKPFDQFAIEQIAGDELVAGQPDRDDASELLIAAGFLRMGPWEHTGMSVAKVTRQFFLDDITDSVGQVFLAQALQCCRCHDHKFDPIPTRDYYAIQAMFATTQFADVDTDWLDSENRAGITEDAGYHQLCHDANEEMMHELAQSQNKNKADRTAEELGLERIGRKWRTRFTWEFDRYKPIAMSVYSGKTPPARNQTSRLNRPDDPMADGTLEQTAILIGGDPFSPAEVVQPGALRAVGGPHQFEFPTDHQGRRTALAHWIASPTNPLTPRVIVNRIWASHFGRGIAANPNNFGATGKKPTHPELLDWLASRLIDNGWSIKNLHRLIMMSDAYSRGSRHPDAKVTDGSYAVFQPRRLAAEELRDSMLLVSGELNPMLGGIPIRPDMNREAALQPRLIMGTFAPSYVPNPRPADRNRRSIYVHKIRGHRLPFLETFNQPGSEKSCELRDSSNITPQVFALLNGQESNDRALALAVRAGKDSESDSATIQRIFQWIYSRDPQPEESDQTIEHWRRMTDIQQGLDVQPQSIPTTVVREAIDENTGQPFQFTERLFALEDYQPDLQRYQVNAKTRGLADVALMLLNSNEFIYVY